MPQVAPAGRLPEGRTEIPFSVPVKPEAGGPGVLYETYHGVNINIQVWAPARPFLSAVRSVPLQRRPTPCAR